MLGGLIVPVKFTVPDLVIYALRTDDIEDMEKHFIEYVETARIHGRHDVTVQVVFLDSDED